jgi:hypothetical protein
LIGKDAQKHTFDAIQKNTFISMIVKANIHALNAQFPTLMDYLLSEARLLQQSAASFPV